MVSYFLHSSGTSCRRFDQTSTKKLNKNIPQQVLKFNPTMTQTVKQNDVVPLQNHVYYCIKTPYAENNFDQTPPKR